MYKIKFNISSLTWVWLRFKTRLRTILNEQKKHAWAHVQSQTQLFEFDLRLAKTQESTRKKHKNAYTESKLIYFNLTWVWLKFSFQLKTHAGAHVQSQTHFCEFDLSLTEIEFTIKNQGRSACTKWNSISWIWLEFD